MKRYSVRVLMTFDDEGQLRTNHDEEASSEPVAIRKTFRHLMARWNDLTGLQVTSIELQDQEREQAS